MSHLLHVQLDNQAAHLVHGRRPDRPAPRRPAPGGQREGPIWNSPRLEPPRPPVDQRP